MKADRLPQGSLLFESDGYRLLIDPYISDFVERLHGIQKDVASETVLLGDVPAFLEPSCPVDQSDRYDKVGTFETLFLVCGGLDMQGDPHFLPGITGAYLMLIAEPPGVRIHETDDTVVQAWGQADIMDETNGEATSSSYDADFHWMHYDSSFSDNC